MRSVERAEPWREARGPTMKHVVSLTVEDKAGVSVRIVGQISRRNISTWRVVVRPSHVPGISDSAIGVPSLPGDYCRSRRKTS